MQTLLLELQHGHLAVVGICDFLLCGYADTKLQPGLLKIKVLALAKHLQDSLKEITPRNY